MSYLRKVLQETENEPAEVRKLGEYIPSDTQGKSERVGLPENNTQQSQDTHLSPSMK